MTSVPKIFFIVEATFDLSKHSRLVFNQSVFLISQNMKLNGSSTVADQLYVTTIKFNKFAVFTASSALGKAISNHTTLYLLSASSQIGVFTP